jgi:aldose 1-epimerase
LLPEQGAAVARLAWRGSDVLAPLPPGADPNASFAGAFLMAPWANRLDAGRLAPGVTLPINRPADNTAIHGLLRDRVWTVTETGPARAVLEQADAAGPLRWHARLEVTLAAAGFGMALRLTNSGDRALPFGSGWHPFFLRPAGTRLRFVATTRCVHDARTLPVAAEPSQGIDGENYEGLDTAFAGWDGVAEIARPDVALRVVATGAWAQALQVFAPVGADFLCVEPVSHLPDAANRPFLGTMDLLAPGETLTGGVLVSAA